GGDARARHGSFLTLAEQFLRRRLLRHELLDARGVGRVSERDLLALETLLVELLGPRLAELARDHRAHLLERTHALDAHRVHLEYVPAARGLEGTADRMTAEREGGLRERGLRTDRGEHA